MNDLRGSEQGVAPWVVLVIGGLGGLIFGYDTGIISPAGDYICAEYFVTDDILTGFVTSIVLVGAMVGSLGGGIVARKLGRQLACFIAIMICLFGGVASAFSIELWLFMALRCILGVGVGLVGVVCPLYVSEMAPKEQRGVFGVFFQLSLTFGILLAYVFGWSFDKLENKSLAWRLMLGTGGALFPLLLLPICLLKMKETKNHSTGEEKRLINTTDLEHDGSGWSGLFNSTHIKKTVTGIILSCTLQLTGINAVMYFGPRIIKTAGFNDAVLLNIIIGVWNFLTTFIAALLVDRLGRRPLIIGGTSVMSLALVGVGLSFTFATDNFYKGLGVGIGLLVFIAGFEGGIGCLFWVLVNEIFDERVREAGSSMANVLQWGFNLIVSTLFPILLGKFGEVVFYIYGGIGVACSIYMVIFLRETKQK